MSSSVEQIKERLGIADVIGSYIKIQKAGANFKALCPFHSEKTPSFHISPSRSSYYCFGCGEKGDIFSFVQKFEGLDFPGALRLLGERAGVPVVYERKETRGERERLYDVLEKATEFFEKHLGEEPRQYLAGRGLSPESVRAWRIGYAPAPETDGWRALLSHLRSSGFSDKEIEQAGLVKRPDGTEGKDLYDRFRGRVMFPINDSVGRVIAFSGRIFPEDKTGAEKTGKYINSPETDLFVKSKTLYGFDKAKGSIRKADFSILVEGQMDVILAHQGGFPNAIALSGTALSPEHLTALGRLSKRMVIALDADNAGISSTGKGARAALPLGFDVKVAALPSGLDPADLISKNKEAFRKAVREAKHIVDFYLETLKARIPDERKLRLEVERVVLPYIADIESAIDQAHFVSRVAEALSIAEEPVWLEVRKRGTEKKTEKKAYVPPAEAQKVADPRTLLGERLFGLFFWQEALKTPLLDISSLEKEMKRLLGDENFESLRSSCRKDSEKLIFAAEAFFEKSPDIAASRDELLENLEKDILKSRLEFISVKLKKAEEEKNHESVSELSREHNEISKKLQALKNRSISL